MSALLRDAAARDAFQTEDFSVRLRDEVDFDVGAEFVNAAQRTVQSAHASVPLRESGR